MDSNVGSRNGDIVVVKICPEGDHEGRTCEVPQEDRSPSMYIIQYMCIIVKRCSLPCYKRTFCKTDIQDVCCLVYIYVPSHHQ
jgi:hypothetical protein